MRPRTKILLVGYAIAAVSLIAGTVFLFEAGFRLRDHGEVEFMFKPLVLALLFLVFGLWVIVFFVTHAYAGQEIEPKDLPRRLYKLVGRSGWHVILEESTSEWTPFGRRQYCVFYKGEVDYDTLWLRTDNNALLRVHPVAPARFPR